MSFEIYFNISRTAVEIITLTAVSIVIASAVKELMDNEDESTSN